MRGTKRRRDLGEFDEGGTGDAEEEAPLWRQDPAESFSDWEIVISCNGGKLKTFHVHKTSLAKGPRQSQYFAAQFRACTRENNDNTSRIDLASSAFNAFPIFLDYMYTGSFMGGVNRDNAVALRHLATYFRVKLSSRPRRNGSMKTLTLPQR